MGSEFESLRVFRQAPCEFPASKSRNAVRNDSRGTPREATHVRSFSFSDKSISAAPVLLVPGPSAVAHAAGRSKKVVLGE